MKNIKIIGCFIALVVLLSLCTGCSSYKIENITLEALCEANLTSNILTHSDSMLIEKNLIAFDGIQVCYIDHEMTFEDAGEYQQAFMGTRQYEYYDGEYVAILSAEPEDMSVYESLMLDSSISAYETIEKIKKEKGSYAISTKMSEDMSYELISGMGIVYNKGDYIEQKYVVSPKTLIMKECVAYIIRANGEKEEVFNYTCKLNAKKPEMAENFYNRFVSEDTRRAELLLDPYADDCRYFHTLSQKGDRVAVILPQGYIGVFSDPECTQKITQYPNNSTDMMLYAYKDESFTTKTSDLGYEIKYSKNQFDYSAAGNAETYSYVEDKGATYLKIERIENADADAVATDIATKNGLTKTDIRESYFTNNAVRAKVITTLIPEGESVKSSVYAVVQRGSNVYVCESSMKSDSGMGASTLLDEMTSSLVFK